MGLFDEVENLAGDASGQGASGQGAPGQGASGQGAEDSVVQDITHEGEQFLDNQTGGKFDSEIQQGGDMLDQQADQNLPNL
jgi:hypothetical protein